MQKDYFEVHVCEVHVCEVHVCVHVCISLRRSVCMCACMGCLCMYTHLLCVCEIHHYTYIHTYIYTQGHVCAKNPSKDPSCTSKTSSSESSLASSADPSGSTDPADDQPQNMDMRGVSPLHDMHAVSAAGTSVPLNLFVRFLWYI
jgi:hypothetical protein